MEPPMMTSSAVEASDLPPEERGGKEKNEDPRVFLPLLQERDTLPPSSSQSGTVTVQQSSVNLTLFNSS